MEPGATLCSRREFLFCYDIKMGNPNGDPDENRPRVLPDKTHYVTDVRLKRFVRDFLKTQGQDILVDTIEAKTTNLTGRVSAYLKGKGLEQAQGRELTDILLTSFADARQFGSSLAFKAEGDWKPGPEPKTLTGAVQIGMGEVKHKAQEVDILGTSVFGSDSEKTQGTFTGYYALRYALIAFNGIANQHNAAKSKMTDADYATLLHAMWYGVRSAANTRTKRGQVPRLLISVEYKPGEEFQFGNLADYVKLNADGEKPQESWDSPDDRVDLSKLVDRLAAQKARIHRVDYCRSPDVKTVPENLFESKDLPWKDLDLDGPSAKAR
jgi:CRISPR-associated protein Csh2